MVAQGFLRQFAQSIDTAMQQQHQEAGSARKQIVHAVQLVRAMPFYGYHGEEKIFMKIVLYNPGQVTRISTLLQVQAHNILVFCCDTMILWHKCLTMLP